MARADMNWVICPACEAGSPAGTSICPRCRCRFETSSDVESARTNRSGRGTRRKLWALCLARLGQLPLLLMTAAMVGWSGSVLMFLPGSLLPVEFMVVVVAASILLWAMLGAALGRRSLAAWAIVGLVSPLMGSLLIGFPASLFLIILRGHLAFPVGLIMGIFAWAILREEPPLGSGRRAGRAVCP